MEQIRKPRYETRTDSRGVKYQVLVAGDPNWREEETKQLRQHQLDNYTREQFLQEGFQ